MGSLTVPPSGLVYLDTNPVIYSVEKHPVYWALLEPLWQAAKAGTVEIVSSDLTLMETLVGPLKSGDTALAHSYERLFQQASEVLALEVQRTPQAERRAFVEAIVQGAAEFITLDHAIKERGKQLEKQGFRAFDALHLASAESSGADFFCSWDDRFLKKAGKQKDLRVRVVSPLQLAEEVSR